MNIHSFKTGGMLPYIFMGLLVLSTLALSASLVSLHTGSAQTGYSAAALFNQGNTNAQHGRIGQAVVNYERARLLAPGDADINANLQWVRDHAGLSTPSAGWMDRVVSWASPNTLALLGWLGLILAGAGILSARFSLRLRTGACLAAFAGTGLMILSAMSAISAWQKCREAVVVSGDVAAKISPTTNGESCFKLRPGEIVSVAGRYNDFTLVKNSAGKSGWVAQGDITPIVPPAVN